MTDTTREIEIFVFIDQDGDFVVDTDPDNIGSRYVDEISDAVPNATRTFHLKLTLPLPKATVVSATIPDTDAQITVTVS